MPITSKETTTMNAATTTTLMEEETNKDFPFIMSSSTYPITLKFMDISYRIKLENKSTSGGSNNLIKMFSTSPGPTSSDIENQTAVIHQERTILNGITGMVSPGEILAVLGPSGSGKSTLLNALAGRLQGHTYTGTILANNRKLTKQVLKRTGFVTQDDVLYPHLTVRETLIFCALLRLPNSLNRNEKIAVTDSVITELGLNKCEDTIIGNSFIRGVSGGERKRVSIAHEMLINPSLLILDEPTSGLDATAAYRLVSTLGSLAKKGKTIITSVHQPSSRVFQMFNSVLVLSEGRCLYFGKGNEAMSYFESVGFSPSFPMNPADFLLDLANGVCQFDGVSEKDKPNVKQTLISTYNNVLAPKVKAACLETTNIVPKEIMNKGTYTCSSSKRSCTSCISNWFNQFSILLQRGLKERRHETFNYLRVCLAVNWRKSCIYPIKEVTQIQASANILGCRIEKLPTVYLGMPLGNNHKELVIWDGIIEKTEKKLANWKSQYLSSGGRTILINSVLDSLPTYVMSLFPMPAKVEERLDKLRRDFLWSGIKEGKRIHLVKWQTALLSRSSGGLGIRNLGLQNKCLLAKWLWRFGREDQALWKEVISNKYGQNSPWVSDMVNIPYVVSVWRTIRNLWGQLQHNIRYKVGNGTRVLFWKDRWIGQDSLMSSYPDIYILSSSQDAMVNEVWSEQGWNFSFRRLLNDWEIGRVAEMLQTLDDFKCTNLEVDVMIWKHNHDGMLSVSRLYNRKVKELPGKSLDHGVRYGKIKCQLK
ncbi:ABC transporter G family member 25-like [Solanum stenotomum]|uniref:ABC transporter G family member 25-like n=1 Tax=Solanum stenotomum TaxID=172797 RepID=UPI0020D1A071|nr:ABC transporter G family member 25-like [Solanum stenotomum]